MLFRSIPEDEILNYSKEKMPFVIIMGTRGKNQKEIDLLGSVTAEVIDRNRTMVFAIPEDTPFNSFSAVKHVGFITNFDQRDLIAFDTFFNNWNIFKFSVSLIYLADQKNIDDAKSKIKLDGIKEYFTKHYPNLDIQYDIVAYDDTLLSFDDYISKNKIDVITIVSYKRNIFARLFNPSIARKMIFHTDTPLLVING